MKQIGHHTEPSERFGMESRKMNLNRSSSGFQCPNCMSTSRMLMAVYQVCEALYPY